MSSIALPDDSPVDPDDELLVAYLDGELDNKAREAVEERLVDDQSLRRRMQALQIGWDWLEELPDSTPSEKLVETTLELVVADIAKPKLNQKSIWSVYRWTLATGLLSLSAIAFTVLAIYSSRQREFRRELEDLGIVEFLDAYDHGSDLILMRDLQAHPSWNQIIAASSELGELQLGRKPLIADTPISERQAAIAEMSLDARAYLAARWDRFRRSDSAKRERIRRTADAVQSQSDSELLLRTMQAYSIWRESLPDELRDQIETEDPSVRRAAIATAIASTQESVSRRSGTMLDDDTIERIYFVLRHILQRRLEAGGEIGEFLRLQRERFGGESSDWIALRLITVEEDGRGARRYPRPMPGMQNLRPVPLSDEELQLIATILSDSARDDLVTLSFGDPRLQLITLRAWASEAVRRKDPRSQEETTLLERYESLTPQERELLDLLPPKELLERLKPPRSFGPPPMGRRPGDRERLAPQLGWRRKLTVVSGTS